VQGHRPQRDDRPQGVQHHEPLQPARLPGESRERRLRRLQQQRGPDVPGEMDLRVLTTGVLALALTSLAGAAAPEPVELTRDGNRVDVRVGGRPFTTYHFDPSVAKPYLSPLRSALGTIVTRAYPMTEIAGDDRDEPHQRAMYFAHGDVNGFDFWGEAAFPKWSDHGLSTFGRTVFRSLDEIRSGDDAGDLQATFELMTPTAAIGEETQRYR